MGGYRLGVAATSQGSIPQLVLVRESVLLLCSLVCEMISNSVPHLLNFSTQKVTKPLFSTLLNFCIFVFLKILTHIVLKNSNELFT